MTNKFFRVVIAVVVVLGIALLAKGQVAWAGPNNAAPAAVSGQGDTSVLLAKPKPGSVKPPPPVLHACAKGLYSVGGVVVMEIKDLEPGYCVEAELSSPYFPVYPIQAEAGNALAHFLFVRIYFHGSLTDDLPAEDGTVDACYAIPPEKQAQFYFYDFYWKRFEKRAEAPLVWDLIDTRVDTEGKTACAFTQVSGVYGLIGK